MSSRAGRVYKGKEKSSGKHVVIKALKKQDILDEGVYRQLQREVETHCRLSHPNIVRMYAYFHDKQQCECARAPRPRGHHRGTIRARAGGGARRSPLAWLLTGGK